MFWGMFLGRALDAPPRRPLPELYGIWEVDSFEADGVIRPSLLTDEQRWRRVLIDAARTRR